MVLRSHIVRDLSLSLRPSKAKASSGTDFIFGVFTWDCLCNEPKFLTLSMLFQRVGCSTLLVICVIICIASCYYTHASQLLNTSYDELKSGALHSSNCDHPTMLEFIVTLSA